MWVYKPASYLPDSSAVERIPPFEVSVPSLVATLYYTYLLQHLEPVSKFQTKVHCQFLPQSPNTFSMKLSSISLVAAGLAAIVGSMAAPLRARALVVANDSLFKHQPPSNWREQHRNVASVLQQSSRANRYVVTKAKRTAEAPLCETREWWLEQAHIHQVISRFHAARSMRHYRAAAKPAIGTLHAEIDDDLERACAGLDAADETLARAPIKRGSLQGHIQKFCSSLAMPSSWVFETSLCFPSYLQTRLPFAKPSTRTSKMFNILHGVR